MSKKVSMESAELPEIAAGIIKWKEKVVKVVEDKKRAEALKEADPIITTYAAVLGWYTSEDGPMDIPRCKEGLIRLVQEYQRITSSDSEVWVRESEMGGRYRSPGNHLRHESHLKTFGYSDADIEYFRKIVQAYELLQETFADFNNFQEGLWQEFQSERDGLLDAWQHRREAAKKEWEKRIESGVAEMVSEEVGGSGEGAVMTKTRRSKIQKEIIKASPFVFEEGCPKFPQIHVENRIESGKLSREELVGEVMKMGK